MKTLYVLVDRQCYDAVQGIFENEEDAKKYADLLREDSAVFVDIEKISVNICRDGKYPYRVFVHVDKNTSQVTYAYPDLGNFDERLVGTIKFYNEDDRYKEYHYFTLARNAEAARTKAITEFKAHYADFSWLYPYLHDRCVECEGGFIQTPYYDTITAQRILLDGQKMIDFKK